MTAAVVPLALQGDLLAILAEDHELWARVAEPFIRRLAATGLPFQAYDVILAGCPDSLAPNAIGPVIQSAARRGLIRAHGSGQSSRPGTRHSLVRTWIGAQT